jgi:hypothetical protein
MTTVRETAATKSSNPLCGKPHVELTLRGMPPATDNPERGRNASMNEVAK